MFTVYAGHGRRRSVAPFINQLNSAMLKEIYSYVACIDSYISFLKISVSIYHFTNTDVHMGVLLGL